MKSLPYIRIKLISNATYKRIYQSSPINEYLLYHFTNIFNTYILLFLSLLSHFFILISSHLSNGMVKIVILY